MAIGLESGPLLHSREKLLQGKIAPGKNRRRSNRGVSKNRDNEDYTTRVSDF